MPKVLAFVQKVDIQGGQLLGTLQFNARVPKRGEWVTVHWGSKRTPAQNNFYWLFLEWCINNGLKEQGHFSAEALHLDLKEHFLSEKTMTKGEFKALDEATTTALGKAEFGEYVEKVNQFMISFFEIDTAPFFKDYEENKI